MYPEGDLCSADKEEEDREIYTKLSVTPVIKRDTSVATALSTRGINQTAGTPGTNKAKDERQW